MKPITDIEELNAALAELELKKQEDLSKLKSGIFQTMELLKPTSLLKSKVKELLVASHFKEDAIETTLSMLAGFVAKAVTVGFHGGKGKQILGNLIQMSVTSLVARDHSATKSKVLSTLLGFIRKPEVKQQDTTPPVLNPLPESNQ